MSEASNLLDQFAKRMTIILLDASPEDRAALIAQIAEEAEAAGLVDGPFAGRMEPVETFVQDLLMDNWVARGWADRAKDWLHPLKIRDQFQLLDAIRPT